MNSKEYLKKIQESIELLADKGHDKELRVLHDMVNFRVGHHTPELESLKDVFYFLNGILFSKGLSDYWNGRRIKDIKRSK